MSSQEALHAHIIALSKSQTWEGARAEWMLAAIFDVEESQTCPCGQYPINEICVISNRITGNTTEVGNICVNNFLKLPSDDLFKSVRYVRVDSGRSFNEEMIEYALDQDFINEWEYKFYLNIRRKRSLSVRQKEKKLQINQKILRRVTR